MGEVRVLCSSSVLHSALEGGAWSSMSVERTPFLQTGRACLMRPTEAAMSMSVCTVEQAARPVGSDLAPCRPPLSSSCS